MLASILMNGRRENIITLQEKSILLDEVGEKRKYDEDMMRRNLKDKYDFFFPLLEMECKKQR